MCRVENRLILSYNLTYIFINDLKAILTKSKGLSWGHCIIVFEGKSSLMWEAWSETSDQVTWLVHATQQKIDFVVFRIPGYTQQLRCRGERSSVLQVSGVRKQNYSCLCETDSSESRASLNGSQSQRVCVCVSTDRPVSLRSGLVWGHAVMNSRISIAAQICNSEQWL